MDGGFWAEHCPARSAGLRHVHADVCADAHTDPRHLVDECCHCRRRAANWVPSASRPIGERINTAADRDLLGMAIDEVVTPQMLRLEPLVGGLKDPLPRPDKPPTAPCDVCSCEHVTNVWQELLEDGSWGEIHVCYGCLGRLIAAAVTPPPLLPANAGVKEENIQ